MISWEKGPIQGVIIKKLNKHIDMRGYLVEIYRSDELPIGVQPVMSYISYTEPGVSRGPHEHYEQTDVFTFIGPGTFKLKLWDNRQGGETYGNCMIVYLGADDPCTVIVPPGVVHGYQNISPVEKGMVVNSPNRLFKGEGKKEEVDEIRHEHNPLSPFRMDDDND